MKRPEHMRRFEKALHSESPGSALWDLAHTLRDEGVSQLDLYFLFEHYHLMFQGDDPKAAAITDTIDIIWGGGWAKGRDLYPHELTSQEIEKHRVSA
jgi:hypothetical protein